MNQSDLTIIYLACGAPFGVYYFLQNRRLKQKKIFWTYTTFAFILWFPFAVYLLWNKLSVDRSQLLTVNEERSIFSIKKQIEAILPHTNSQISIYNLRETFERYVGLTRAIYAENNKSTDAEKEIFRISVNSNVELAATCQHRRNRKRLFFHQTLARQDFLQTIAELSELNSNKKKLGKLSLEFVKLLKDFEAQEKLEKIFTNASQFEEKFANNSQTNKNSAVKYLEKDLWNSEIQKPPPVNPISTRLQTMSATNSPGKD